MRPLGSLNFGSLGLLLIIKLFLIGLLAQAQIQTRQKADNVVAEMQVICQSDAIMLRVNTNTPFRGMVYAKDAPNLPGCVSEFSSATNMTYRLPLKSCGTVAAEVDDGIEYFNTVVVQPHMRLMTNQGKGYHVRCKYQTRERTIANTHFNVSAAFQMANNQQTFSTPLLATASMPSCTMKIFRSGRDDVAEAVKIGDKLIMVIEIDQQDMYGMRITNCVVRDGLNTAEQLLINDSGCPIDESIMPMFEYTNNATRAAVSFPAHKFPHTSSVYYQCNVRLCINNGGCEKPDCSFPAHSTSAAPTNSSPASLAGLGPRRKRFATHNELPPRPGQTAKADPSTQAANKRDDAMSFDVYSGLYVSDIDIDEAATDEKPTTTKQTASPEVKLVGSASSQQSTQSELVCLSAGRLGLALVLVCIVSVGVSVMLLCQIGGTLGLCPSCVDASEAGCRVEQQAPKGRFPLDMCVGVPCAFSPGARGNRVQRL